MVTHSKRLPVVISGACDGEIKVWNVTTKECSCSVPAHSGFVRGMGINQVKKTQNNSLKLTWNAIVNLSISIAIGMTIGSVMQNFQAGDLLLSVGDDQVIRMWNVDQMLQNSTVDPSTTITSKVSPAHNVYILLIT